MKTNTISVMPFVVVAALSTAGTAWACGTYSVSSPEVTDAGTEYKLRCDGFHFGTVFVRAADPLHNIVETLIFRPHPDQLDLDGWGTSWFMAPFLSSAEPTSGTIDSITAEADGIQVNASGFVAKSGVIPYGAWSLDGIFTYDSFTQEVSASGDLVVDLIGTLAAANLDLNLERLSSNYLHNVPLQSDGIGDTGDMKEAIVIYGDQNPHNFVWHPPLLPSHFPTDVSDSLEIAVIGQFNEVDTQALGEGFQIEPARKPTLALTFSSDDAPLSAGLQWDGEDGHGQDFAADNVGINHLVLKGNSNATQLAFNFILISTTTAKSPWDFNYDGRSDILWRNATTGENWLYRMNGASIQGSQAINTVADLNWKIVGIGDFDSDGDGDGQADILWRNSVTGQNWIYLMDGANILHSQPINTVADLNWQVAGVGDFDGDQKADILWHHSTTGENWLYRMNGSSIQASVGINRVADLNWKIVGVADFNGDRKADILWRNSATGENWLYLMDGANILESHHVNRVENLNWKIAGVADFEGDHKADILWRNSVTGENWMYLMNGAVILESHPINTVVDLNWKIAGVADFDGDGRSDILWRNSASGENWMYLMDGASIQGSHPINTVSNLNWQIQGSWGN